jgi:trimeric autotransporter adhesin
MHPLTQLKKATPLILALGCFAFLSIAQAVVPPPDGGYPNANTAEGDSALQNLTAGSFNTALGIDALFKSTASIGNTATGAGALLNNTGDFNTANGAGALINNTAGSSNIALGLLAGANLTTGDNNIDIGNAGGSGESNTIRIGTQNTQTAAFMAGISGQSAIGGDAVFVTSAGKLGTTTVVSSQRFKDDIKAMGKDSEAILTFKPVTFRYKKEIDSGGIRQFGLVAEEVEKVAPELVKRDREGKPYTVRYDAVNAMLLNEFLKEHQKVKGLEAALAAVNKRLKAQDAKIDKVNARVELTKPAPQTVAENR